jgi:hypothetical protein
MRYYLLSITCLWATAIISQDQDKSWPTSATKVESVASNATAVIVAIANGNPIITRRVPINTGGVISKGDQYWKERYKSVYVSCAQPFTVVELLAGEGGSTNLIVQYTYLEKCEVLPSPGSDEFLLPKKPIEHSVDTGERAILFLSSSTALLKIISDNETNRNLIAPVLKELRDRPRGK